VNRLRAREQQRERHARTRKPGEAEPAGATARGAAAVDARQEMVYFGEAGEARGQHRLQ
jgi:hypothetical protein